MQFIVYAIIVSSLSFEFLAREGWAPSQAPYLQEITAIFATLAVLAYGVRNRFENVAAIYWVVFGALALTVACGIFVNGVGTGPTFAGLRNYLRAIPFFFLPAVFRFSEVQVKRQLQIILAFALIQLPIAFDQRMETFGRGNMSGDLTVGTIMNSGHLSIFLLCVASVLFGFYLRGRISLKRFALLLPVILAPTMLNETKATVLLVPAALFAILVIGAERNRLRKSIAVIASVAVFLAVFIPVYDFFMKPRWGYGLVDFVMQEGRVEGYLDKGAEVGSYDEPGRIDGFKVPIQVLSRDPSLLAFGLGIGNVSRSSIGSQFTGEHYLRYGHFVMSLASLLIWETGLLGLFLVLSLFWLLFRDALVLSRGRSLYADFALGGLGMIAVMGMSLPYRSMIDSGALSFLFWYFAGLVAAERVRLAAPAAAPVERSEPLDRVAGALS